MPILTSESAEHIKSKHRMARWLERLAGNPAAFEVVVEYPFSDAFIGNSKTVKSWLSHGFVRKPTKHQLRACGAPVMFICDIALIENDTVTTAIEIVHTHYTPSYKVNWLEDRGVKVYEAYASTILAIKGAPASFDDILMEI